MVLMLVAPKDAGGRTSQREMGEPKTLTCKFCENITNVYEDNVDREMSKFEYMHANSQLSVATLGFFWQIVNTLKDCHFNPVALLIVLRYYRTSWRP